MTEHPGSTIASQLACNNALIHLAGCSDPVFICGSPRAGTTFLWDCLRRHPELAPRHFVAKELSFFHDYFIERVWRQDNDNEDKEIALIYERNLVQFINAFQSIYIGSKTGRYVTAHPLNVFYIPPICRVIPLPRFLILDRHPEEIVWSMFHHKTAQAAGWRSKDSIESDQINTADIESNLRHWEKIAGVCEKASRGDYGGSTLLIRHDDLIEDKETVIMKIFRHIDVAEDQDVLERMRTQIVNSSFVMDGPSSSRFAHKKEYYIHLVRENAMFRQMCEIAARVSADTMKGLGYTSYLNFL